MDAGWSFCYSNSPPGFAGWPNRTGRSCATAVTPDLLLPEPGRDFDSAGAAEDEAEDAEAAAELAPRTGDELRDAALDAARDAGPDLDAPPDLGLAPPTPAPPAPPPLAFKILSAISACNPLSSDALCSSFNASSRCVMIR